MEYEAVIGLEVHVQVKTVSKLFTPSGYTYGADANTLTDPVVLGLPGTLPVLNEEAVRQAIRTGLIFDCTIPEITRWDRKNYFYPDNPKNYQISQLDHPICKDGFVEIELPGPSRNVMGEHKKIALDRIQLEEDVGKLTHEGEQSLIDFNRAGVPLMEIVSLPDLQSADEAFAYLTSLRMHLSYANISDCDMEKGQMRCDANVSVRPKGQKKLGTKVELKNLNSISGVRNGIAYEIQRQQQVLAQGGHIVQETRKWDADKGVSIPMRSKETVNDYRYFPDPDLVLLKIERSFVDELQQSLPEFPFQKQERFFITYDLPYTITSVFYPNSELCDYFEEAVKFYNQPKAIANLIANDFLRELSETRLSITKNNFRITPQQLAELVKLTDEGTISKQTAQDIFIEMFRTGKDAKHIIEDRGLAQNSNEQELVHFCKAAIENNPKAVAEYRSGKITAINALKGSVMKASGGQANPALIDKILHQLLDS
ncbi:MAG: Asp-tRNA(Asn)/Glu-tRNA(Gln) amidotransferase subunit GatB [Puniceicoccales bacterium]|jgi:aspartyl-tRNA(Asn)/glutamyl-tRNA(Gln) amidotransferase subunit B|nr:Asp-tRNA(Asn)/Glu-tRNA(Gln) amidotransferase subunit GatB [Puniceicoccales bacterium]